MLRHRLLSGSACSFLLVFPGISLSAGAQTTAPNEWTWMGGSNTLPSGCSTGISICEEPATYGTLGTPASVDTPGGRAGANAWTDESGNLWLFGGVVSSSAGNPVYLNDLWRFSPTANEWTWMGGSDAQGPCITWFGSQICGQSGIYGTRGTAAAQNYPGGRWGASHWRDSSGNFWIFGGFGVDANAQFGSLNDLWMYNPTTSEWTWVSGSSTLGSCASSYCGQAGVYGTLGSPAVGNSPGGRDEANTWVDQSGNLWLFGGEGFDSTDNWSYLNDLWMFSPSTSSWEWLSGSNMPSASISGCSGCVPGVRGLYGPLGTFSSAFAPGSRDSASGWTDQDGNLWLFGGYGFDSGLNLVNLNDLWEFNSGLQQWAWIGGASTVPEPNLFEPGVYGTLGSPSSANIPGGRNDAAYWTDSSGKFWLFGGYLSDRFSYSDLWTFDSSTTQWAWMGGSSAAPDLNDYGVAGAYGQLGVPSSTNAPGARRDTSSWVDANGNAWLYGGDVVDSAGTYGLLNDLWTYQPYANASLPTFSVAGGNYTSAQSVSISDATAGAIVYYTTDGTSPTAGSTQYTGPITVSSSETIEAIALAPGYTASAVASATYTINLPAPSFSVAGTALTVAPGETTGNTSTITLTPSNGFTGAISLSCAITPEAANDPATCSVPASITISGATAETTTLTVNTAAATTSSNQTRKLFWPSAGGTALACILLASIPARRRRWQSMLGILVLLFSITGGVSACGGGGGNGGGGAGNPGTTPGTYTITVTGTSGAITQTGTVSLTVQ